MSESGEYIIYVDESGDHDLSSINAQYPVFVLSFCIFHIPTYVGQIVPEIQRLKFKYFGHDMVILHETEIRKQEHPFQILRNKDVREEFMSDLSGIIGRSPFTIVASAIEKERYKAHAGTTENPYHVALEYGLERVFMFLQGVGQRGKVTHVVFEGRGKKEDDELELEFRRIMDRTHMNGMADTLRFLCVSKKSNSAGLQLADMTARPIGLKIIRPEQPNRAWDLIQQKIRTNASGNMHGFGLKVYP
ncbi:DUF3800 domain-containing protein [Leucobacter salsicius]|uniref:DUF3800 domain-containing protein n=1 Tax=Leucobacter salsicius TaxID=664638 RepID=UPI00034B2A27|nr:DUF3800 domain-containing protein [Leucobacter salsicius]